MLSNPPAVNSMHPVSPSASHPKDAVQCFKMHGSGNDFVLMDNRSLCLTEDLMPAWARSVCHRGFGVGADGLIFLDAPRPDHVADYSWHFFNADGSRAEMCGNGARCAARLAWRLGLAPAKRHVLGTDVGPIRAHVHPEDDRVTVQLTPHRDLRLNIGLSFQGVEWDAHFVNTGVPHLVLFVPDVSAVDIHAQGKEFRNHPGFAPAGTNVNFVQVVNRENLVLRTYERGVEGETLACGTGAAAAALVAFRLDLGSRDVLLRTSGGEELGIMIDNDMLFLTGKAVLVFSAKLYPRSLGLAL